MDSQDNKILLSPGTKSPGVYVCKKCGWNYPNPHPSAKNRRSHKKICGTIKGFEVLDSEKAKKDLDLQDEHCFNDEGQTPNPRYVKKADERIGGIGDVSEEDVFADAVCEFSPSPFGLVADSVKEDEERARNSVAKSTKNPCETQLCSSSLTGCVMKSSEVSNGVPSLVETAATEEQSLVSEAHVVDGGGNISDVGLATESKGILHVSQKINLLDESESKLGSASGTREDNLDAMWDDEVIYSDVEGPHGIALETAGIIQPGEADYIVSESGMVDTSPVKANAAQVISTSQPAISEKHSYGMTKDKDDIPLLSVPDETLVENADVSLPELKGIEASKLNHSVEPFHNEIPKEEIDTATRAESLGVEPERFMICREVPSSEKLLLENKTESQGQTALVVGKEFPSAENVVVSKIENAVSVESSVDAGESEMKGEENESSHSASQKTVESENLKVSLPVANPIVGDSNADVSPAANSIGVVDLLVRESELIQANTVAGESDNINSINVGNNPNSQLTSESSRVTELYVSPVSIEHEGDDASDQRRSKKSKDSLLQIGAETCQSNDNTRGESSIGLVEDSCLTNTKEYPLIQPGSTSTAPVKTASENLPERGRADFHRVVGGLGVIQGNEIDCNIKKHNFYAEVPVTIESNDYRDLGRLQNLSKVHIRSLVSSPLVNRTASHASEGAGGINSQPFQNADNVSSVRNPYDSSAGLDGGLTKPENTSKSSLAVALSKNQEIMEKTTDWCTEKEQQHVPLKNLLNEARTPKIQAKDESISSTMIPKVSSILGQDTSPDARWPSKREVSEEWNSPARYPVDLKREERKVKGKPFWVPFVCCSSVN